MTDEEIKNNILVKNARDISRKDQEVLNTPEPHPDGISEEDRGFLKMLIEKLVSGEINPYQPSSLYNHPVYDKLSEEARAKAEIDAFNLLSTIREIYKLWQNEHRETYQIENLVHRIRLTKERLEEIGGDIFII